MKISAFLVILSAFSVFANSPAIAKTTHYLECRVTDKNEGCVQTWTVPPRERVVGITAACNLEHGAVTNRQLASIPPNTVRIVKRTGKKSEIKYSYCKVDDTSISTGSKSISVNYGARALTFGCKEYDRNGGDCHIRLKLTTEDAQW